VLREIPNEGLGRYRIGQKLRSLRLRRKMGLADLGKRTGLSAAMLSKVERGRLVPTLPTLHRISSVFGVGLDHFFAGLERLPMVSIIRRKDRVPPPLPPTGRLPPHRMDAIDFAIEHPPIKLIYAEFEPRPVAPNDRHSHAGFEIVFVLAGRVTISFDDVEYLVESGDAIYFEADRPHGYCRQGHDRCSAVIVTSAE
jgi:transcriptional regulator with XRE-family HTH domain